MRKIMRILPIVALLLCAALIGCSGAPSAADLKRLSPPSRLQMTGSVIGWNKVENASGYRVIVDGKEYETENTSFDLSAVVTSAGTYKVEVMALGKGSYLDSGRVSATYKHKEIEMSPPEDLSPTEGLRYKLLEDGSGYEVYKGRADLRGTVVIPEEHDGLPVTRIAQNGFGDWTLNNDPEINTVTTSIILPSTLLSIGDEAFTFYQALEEIVIPDGVKSIGKRVFYQCIRLREIKLSDGLEEVGWACFSGCSSLKSIVIPDGVKTLTASQFSSCTALEDITFPAGLESISAAAIHHTPWYKNHPDDFIIVNGKFLVGYNGPADVGEFPPEIKTIASRAFSYSKIRSITVPSGIEICSAAFSGCVTLESATLPNEITAIPVWLFKECRSLTGFVLPPAVKTIGELAFACVGFASEVLDLSGVTEIGKEAFTCIRDVKEVIFGKDIKTIPAGVLLSSPVEKVTVSEGTVAIGEKVFYECDALREIELPNSLESIGTGAFGTCSALEEISLPPRAELGRMMFDGCSALTSVTLPSDIAALQERVFQNCTSLKSIALPSGLKKIGIGAFGGSGLTSIDLTGVEEIATLAFSGCIGLKEATLPGGLKTIGTDAFSGCTSLQKATFADGATTTGEGTFKGCTALESVSFPESLETIDKEAFMGCIALKGVVFPEGLTKIGVRAFSGCSSIDRVEFPKGLNTVGSEAFGGCDSLKNMVFPLGGKGVVLSACFGCPNIEWVVVPSGFIMWYKTEEYIKERLPALKHIYYRGTKAEWDAKFVKDPHPDYESLMWFYSEEPPTDEGRYWRFDGDVPVIWE